MAEPVEIEVTTSRVTIPAGGALDPGSHARLLRHCGQSLLREVAAGALGCVAGEVSLRRTCPTCGPGDHGRPVVDGGSGLEVSLSHSGTWLVVAASWGVPVGVDVEVGAGPDRIDGILDLVLAPAEAGLPPWSDGTYGRADVLRTWTRKEAVLKAYGVGLAVPMTEVELRPAGRATAGLPGGRAVGSFADVDLAGSVEGVHCAVAAAADRPLRVHVHERAPFDAEDPSVTGS